MISQIRKFLSEIDSQASAALVTCAVSVTALHYTSNVGELARDFPSLQNPAWGDLGAWGLRLALRMICYVILPLAVARIYGQRELHLGAPEFRRHLWISGALFLGVLPFAVAASYTERFRNAYPQGHSAHLGPKQLVVWLAIYGASFFTIEFFYRGFLLTMMRRAFGVTAIFVAMVPYVMIHFPKPPAETAGAIITGLVLGALAMATRSIWYGLLVHISVAWTMELLALHHKHQFPFN